ncbi:MAG: glycerate kinase [Acidimicrobiia bacterium]
MRADHTVNEPVADARRLVERIWRQAVDAVDPAERVLRSLQGSERPTHVLAVGKAAVAMSRGAHAQFGAVTGLAVSADERAPAPNLVHVIGDHPLPGNRSLEAGTQAVELVQALGEEHHLLVLLSGGASALMELPQPGITISHIRDTTVHLMHAGADIEELNTVRTHLSVLKGGGLARLAGPARVTTLAMSDVIDDPPHVIGSAPTVPTATSPKEALDILDEYDLRDVIKGDVITTLESQAGTRYSLEAGDYRIVANMADVANAAASAARAAGLSASILTTRLAGEAREAAPGAIRRALAADTDISLLAGETTVTVQGDGVGGRSQEAALAGAIYIAGRPDIVFLAAGTDGKDGPTPAAGGIVDGGSVERVGSVSEARAALERNDSATWLAAAGDQLVTGPTGTNVGDLWVIWTHRS